MQLRECEGQKHAGAFAPDGAGSRVTKVWQWWHRIVLLLLVVGLTPNCSKVHDVLFVNYTNQPVEIYRSGAMSEGDRVATVHPWRSRLVEGKYIEAGVYWVFRASAGPRIGSVLLDQNQVRESLYDGRLLIVEIRPNTYAGPYVRLDETGSSLGDDWTLLPERECRRWLWKGGAEIGLELCRNESTAEWYLLYRVKAGKWIRTDGPFFPGSSIPIR
jgi:hypothetical protein